MEGESVRCPNCNREVSVGVNFCSHCGTAASGSEQLRQSCAKDVELCLKAISDGEGSRGYLRKSFGERLADWQKGAEAGVGEAQWLLGRCYDEGFGVEKNQVYAISWHLKAAEAGFAAAQSHIGSCYLDGDGVAADPSEAVCWLTKAAQQGYAPAQSYLGWCYDTGSGVEVDQAEAVKWFTKAAEQDDETAQFNLAVHLESGSGIDRDQEGAVVWYRKAAENGYGRAQEALEQLQAKITEEKKRQRDRIERAKAEFRDRCRYVLASGQENFGDAGELLESASSLELESQTAKKMFEQEKAAFEQAREQQHQLVQAEAKFRAACDGALADGEVTLEEKAELKDLVRSLKLSGETAKKIFAEQKKLFKQTHPVALSSQVESQFRKACRDALEDGKITEDEREHLSEMSKFFKIPSKSAKEIFDDEKKNFLKAIEAGTSEEARQRFLVECRKALADGKVTLDEKHQLAHLAKSLNLSKQAARTLFEQEKRSFQKGR